MLKILIIDDEAPARNRLRRMLADITSVECVGEADSALKALEIIPESQANVLLLDISMPGMDGIDLMQRIMDRDNSVPIVVNTAYSSYKDNFLTYAADAFLVKSSDVSELIRTAKKLT